MDVRRLTATMGTALLGAAVAAAGLPGVAYAAPAAPGTLTVARATGDPHKVQISWKAVTGVDHYTLEIVDRDVQSVVTMPSTATTYTLDNPDPCSSYKIRVGAADASGAAGYTGYWTLKSLTPGYVQGQVADHESNGSTGLVTFRAPAWAGYTDLTGYHVVITRQSDNKVMADKRITDTAFRLPVDPAGIYNVETTAENEFGGCLTAKSLMDKYRPGDPTNLVVTRKADAPENATVTWQAPAGQPVPTYYTIQYGQTYMQAPVKVDAPATSTVLKLDPTKAWNLQIRSYNENGGSNQLLGTIPVWDGTTAAAVPSTSPSPVPTTAPTSAAPAPSPSEPTSSAPPSSSDKTPPTITATVSSQPVNFWYRNPVTIHYTCSDAQSGIATCPDDVTVRTNGEGQKIIGTAIDKAGNSTSVPVTVNIDQVAPRITASVSGDVNGDGWYTRPVTVHFTCSDEGSSTLLACPPDEKVSTDGIGRTVTGTATDKAGNTATAAITLNVDLEAPEVTAKVIGDISADGWYHTPPTVHFTCKDVSSGIADCPADQKVDTDGADRTVSGTATDKAGNTSTASVMVSLDQTAPQIAATVLGVPNADGWHHSAPVVHFTCSDTGAGVANCPEDQQVYTDGGKQQITGTATDKAGNTATASVSVDVDQAVPQIKANIVGEANAAGWYATPPTIHFTCTDLGSGIASCPDDKVVGTDGASQQVLGIAYDKAGNTAAATVEVNVDRTAPGIAATIVGDASRDGWYRTAPTVHFTCTDATSGVATCPADIPVTAEGAAQRISGTGSDKAGNPATAAVLVNVDLTNPAVTAGVVGDASPDGWYRTAPTVHFTCTDALSGVAACPTDQQITSDGAGQNVTGTGTDKAGNPAGAATKVNVDQAAPTVTATVVGDLNSDGWYRTAPTVHFTCADAGSGVASCPADRTVTTDGSGQQISGTGTDKAGNTATATVKVNVDLTAPAITASVVGDAGPDGWYRTAPTVRYSCTDNLSGVAACPTDQKVTAEGAGQNVTGTATDKARNVATAKTKINVDRTAPTVSVTGATDGTRYAPDAMPTVGCATADTGSGVNAKATATIDMDDRGGYTVTCAGATDKAGNSAAPVKVGYTVKPSVEWLKALTHQYLATANHGTLTDLDNKLDHGQFALYSLKILGEALSKKPTVTPANAAALMYWAAVLDRLN
ncbi:Neogenin [Krasilnikovia sp. MM14-A1259]|uniref:fibronectin type III domain-containing protein n=1 Tax=Krasilnikovia sp. MM14-A1259 TaxID=3373539 RepID=UPI0038194034